MSACHWRVAAFADLGRDLLGAEIIRILSLQIRLKPLPGRPGHYPVRPDRVEDLLAGLFDQPSGDSVILLPALPVDVMPTGIGRQPSFPAER